MWKKLLLSFTCNILLLTIPNGFPMAAKVKEIPIPDDVARELAYVLKYIEPENNQLEFESERISNLLDFVAEPKAISELHHIDSLFGIPSAYYSMAVNKSLAHVLRYAHNPDIPYCTIAPSSVRICQLKKTDQGPPSWPRLWELLSNLDKPITEEDLLANIRRMLAMAAQHQEAQK